MVPFFDSSVFSYEFILTGEPFLLKVTLKTLSDTTVSLKNFIVEWAYPTFESFKYTSNQRSNSLN